MAEKNENTIKVLNTYGVKTVKDMKKILIKNNKRATGSLVNSIEYEIVYGQDNKPVLNISYNGYGQFVAGRNRRNDPGNPPRWKSKGPPVKAIKAWLMAKNIPYKSTNGKKPKGRMKQVEAMAFMIIRKIKERGRLNPIYKNPTDFVKPYDDMIGSRKFYKDLSKALAKDGLTKLSRKPSRLKKIS